MKFLFVRSSSHGLFLVGCGKLLKNFRMNILITVTLSCNLQMIIDAHHLTSTWNSTFKLFSFFFCIDGYKSKSSGVLQKCRGYGYVDIMQMKKIVLSFFDISLLLQNKTKLSAQHRRHLETCLLQETLYLFS